MKTVMCDMDKVIRSWKPFEAESAELSRTLGVPERCLLDIALTSPLIDEVTVGAITYETWCDRVKQRLTDDFSAAVARSLVAHWDANCGSLNTSVVGDLYTLKHMGLQLVLVTNATDKLDADLDLLGLSDLFHHVCNSSAVGSAKPHRPFYEAALAMAGTAPENCWFVDDHPENVETAIGLGMKGSVFDGSSRLIDLIDESFYRGAR